MKKILKGWQWRRGLSVLAMLGAVVGGVLFTASAARAQKAPSEESVTSTSTCQGSGWICAKSCRTYPSMPGAVICVITCESDPDFMGPPYPALEDGGCFKISGDMK